MKYSTIFVIVLIAYILILEMRLSRIGKEGLETSDLSSIKSLGAIAKSLSSHGTITIPGNLKVEGSLTANGVITADLSHSSGNGEALVLINSKSGNVYNNPYIGFKSHTGHAQYNLAGNQLNGKNIAFDGATGYIKRGKYYLSGTSHGDGDHPSHHHEWSNWETVSSHNGIIYTVS
jgi:hypothetical protein